MVIKTSYNWLFLWDYTFYQFLDILGSYSYGHLSVISTYNPIYRMYNPIYNQL